MEATTPVQINNRPARNFKGTHSGPSQGQHITAKAVYLRVTLVGVIT